MSERTHDDELVLLLGQIDGKVDILLEEHRENKRRITTLEGWRNKLVGAYVGLAGAFAYAAKDHLGLVDVLHLLH